MDLPFYPLAALEVERCAVLLWNASVDAGASPPGLRSRAASLQLFQALVERHGENVTDRERVIVRLAACYVQGGEAALPVDVRSDLKK